MNVSLPNVCSKKTVFLLKKNLEMYGVVIWEFRKNPLRRFPEFVRITFVKKIFSCWELGRI